MDKAEYFEKAAQYIIDANEDAAVELAQKYLDEGLEPTEMIEKGLSEGIRKLGDLFDRGEVFLPHLIIASEAMTAAVKVLEKALPEDQVGKKLAIGIYDNGLGLHYILTKYESGRYWIKDSNAKFPEYVAAPFFMVVNKQFSADLNFSGTNPKPNTYIYLGASLVVHL